MKISIKKETAKYFINIIILFAICFNNFFVLNFSANNNLDQNAISDIQNQSQDITEEHKEKCPCGRDIYHEDGQNYSKYDCVKCKKNMYLCTCPCWCGAPSYWETSKDTGQTTMFCRKCNLPCSDCTCADKAIALLKEQQMSEGKLSILNIPKPKNIISLVVLSLFITIFLILWLLFKNILENPMQSLEGNNNGIGKIKEFFSKVIQNKATSSTYAEEENLDIKTEEKTKSVIKWPTEGKLPAIFAYEFSNNILYDNKKGEESENYLLNFIKDYFNDSEDAMANSLLGKYGDIKKIFAVAGKLDLKNETIKQKLSSAVGEDFWDIVEDSAEKILEKYDIDDVTAIAFCNEIKIGKVKNEISEKLKDIDLKESENQTYDFTDRFPEMIEFKRKDGLI